MKKICLLCVLLGMLLTQPGNRLAAQEGVGAHASGESSTPEAQSPEKNKSEADENAIYRKSPMVRKMGAMVGMNADQSATTFEVANFLLLAVLLGWFLLKALPKAFRSRNTAIQKHLVDARTATEEANARLGSVEDRLGKLDGMIAELRAQSEKDAVAEEQRIKASTEDEKAKILAAAEQEIAAATVQARRELQKYAAELAIEQAGRKLVVNDETDRLLVQAFAHRLSQGQGAELMANVFAPRYAQAFAQVAAAKGLDVAAAQQQIRDFAGTLAGSPELHEILMDPSISEDQKLRVLDAIAGRIGMMREVRNLLAVIMNHNRLDALNEILTEYALLADEGSGVAEAEIVSAHELNPDDRAALEAEVAKLAGGRVRATYTRDASLLGGAVVRMGSTVYDGSVRGQLERLKAKLIQA